MISMDNSTGRAVARCSTEALIRYVHGYTSKEDSYALSAGSAAHTALDTYGKSGGDSGKAMQAFTAEYAPKATEVDSADRLSLANTSAVLREWFARHPFDRLPWGFADGHFEEGFSLPLTESVEFIGRLDGIVRNKTDGNWYVLEHKTTGQISSTWKRQFLTSSQITGYIYAARQLTGKNIVGAFINAIEFSKLPGDPSRRCAKHNTKYAECGHEHAKHEIIITQRTAKDVEDWKLDFLALAKRYAYLAKWFPKDAVDIAPQEGKFHGACSWCAFNTFCAMGRPVHAMDSLLKYERWSPLDSAEAK